MNTDFYYEIGHSHISCQDYALAGQASKDISFALVSDGCSASKNVDIGARILVHSALNFLRNECINSFDIFKNAKASEFCIPIISSAHNVMKSLNLDLHALDATLLMAISSGIETRVFVYGDGAVIVKKKDGTVKCFTIEYNDGAPYYLSYLLDAERQRGYFAEFNQTVYIHERELMDGNLVLKSSNQYQAKDIYDIATWTFADVETITLISDGYVSYEKILDNRTVDKIPLGRVIEGISKFKNFNGQFVERRMLNFRRECQRESIGHYDDIGVASIYLGK